MGRENNIVERQESPGSAKETGNTLLLHFGFNVTGGRGRRVQSFQ